MIVGKIFQVQIGQTDAVIADFRIGRGRNFVQVALIVKSDIAFMQCVFFVVYHICTAALVDEDYFADGIVFVQRPFDFVAAAFLSVDIDHGRQDAVFEYEI